MSGSVAVGPFLIRLCVLVVHNRNKTGDVFVIEPGGGLGAAMDLEEAADLGLTRR
jgi:hypothetical protein